MPGNQIKSGVLFVFFLIPGLIFCQPKSGRVVSSDTREGIGFVNIGVIGRNTGTVSDIAGNYLINLNSDYDLDSIRFSIIGYESKSFLVSHFRENQEKDIYMTPVSYNLPEISVSYSKPVFLRIGNPVITDELRSGFSNNELGSELGIREFTRKRVVLKDINLNVAICTYDSVTYRLNIYQTEDQIIYKNILKQPVYISFKKDQINKVLTFDISKYSIVVQGEVLITLELYRDLGQGRLLFRTEYFTGITYHRKTSEGDWTQAPGVIGMYLNTLVLK